MNDLFILSIIGLYLATIIGIGVYASKKTQSTSSFFLADRSLKSFALTATITATTVGGSATIVAGGRIYAQGLPAIWYDLGGALGLVILGLFIAYHVRKTGLFTLPDITGYLFDDRVRYAAAILIIITEIAWISLLIQASGFILSVVLPFEYTAILIIITIGFIGYTLLGGQYAVVYTDIIQFLVMIIGICAIAAPLLFLEALPHLGQLPATLISFPVNEEIGFITAGSIFFMMFFPHVVGPDIYSKLLSAENEKTAKTGAVLSGVFKLVFAIAIGIIAISAFILHPGLSNPYLAIPTAVFHLPLIPAAIILSGFLSVMLSSADSCLLSAGTILSVDILRNKNVNLSRLGILGVGVGALLLALYLGDILKTLQLAYTVFTGGLTLPIIFGFFREKTQVTSKGALWSLILGGMVSLLWLHMVTAPYNEYAVLVGLFISLLPLLIFRAKTS